MPSPLEWVNKLQWAPKVEYYTVIKVNKLQLEATKPANLTNRSRKESRQVPGAGTRASLVTTLPGNPNSGDTEVHSYSQLRVPFGGSRKPC